MRLLTIGENEAGQRLDRFLEKYMDQAPKSFFYKMLRKKNITLNGKRAEGKERLLPETRSGFSLRMRLLMAFPPILESLERRRPQSFFPGR